MDFKIPSTDAAREEDFLQEIQLAEQHLADKDQEPEQIHYQGWMVLCYLNPRFTWKTIMPIGMHLIYHKAFHKNVQVGSPDS